MRTRSGWRTFTHDGGGRGDTGTVYLRRDKRANWHSVNPVLEDREVAYELDTDRFKVGDGKTAWSDLPYYAKSEVAPDGRD